jgi:hypothetical protein
MLERSRPRDSALMDASEAVFFANTVVALMAGVVGSSELPIGKIPI